MEPEFSKPQICAISIVVELPHFALQKIRKESYQATEDRGATQTQSMLIKDYYNILNEFSQPESSHILQRPSYIFIGSSRDTSRFIIIHLFEVYTIVGIPKPGRTETSRMTTSTCSQVPSVPPKYASAEVWFQNILVKGRNILPTSQLTDADENFESKQHRKMNMVLSFLL